MKILIWNVLCKEFCNAASFPKVTSESLDWTKRKQLIRDFLSSHSAQLLYLTEVDTYQEFYGALLAELGYRVIVEVHRDLIAFKKEEIVIFNKKSVFYNDGSQFYIKMQISENLMLFCTHFKSKFDPECRERRLNQAKQLRAEMELYLHRFNVLVCGGFNDYPDSEPLNVLMGKEFQCLSSEDVSFTSFKIREKTGKEKGIKDYFLLAESDNCTAVSKSISSYDVSVLTRVDEEHGLPNEDIPSDHLPVVLDLELTSSEGKSRFALVSSENK